MGGKGGPLSVRPCVVQLQWATGAGRAWQVVMRAQHVWVQVGWVGWEVCFGVPSLARVAPREADLPASE